ncbi:hypothetical protein EQ831_12405 [Pseudomonas sp. ALS1279]|nr:hypothetical protein EQ831_12405 [Pseudomonas sp. ALS1279]
MKTTYVGNTALKNDLACEPSQNAHLQICKLRFFGRLTRWRSPFGPACGCYSRWSLRLVLPASPTFSTTCYPARLRP